jgi:hypothetical protein
LPGQSTRSDRRARCRDRSLARGQGARAP